MSSYSVYGLLQIELWCKMLTLDFIADLCSLRRAADIHILYA